MCAGAKRVLRETLLQITQLVATDFFATGSGARRHRNFILHTEDS